MKILTVSALVCALMSLTTADGESDIVKRSASCTGSLIPFRGRCFYYDNRLMTWADAEKSCQGYPGGHLASVRNADDLLNIQKVIKKWTAGKSPVAWIGGSDAEQDGKWFWSDGSSFKYEIWAAGQPDYRGTCLTVNKGGQKEFDDQPCNAKYPFVCSRKP